MMQELLCIASLLFEHLVSLQGAGMGVTPFLSVLKQLMSE